ncbi:MAG TPA: SAM-dependent methyltransferase [Micromonosporaceae bacterium]|nr:SAM-dependent methyltransferase [Micromonosporaceae bacterium]
MTVDLAYFEEMYAANTDPWGFGERWYEHRKRQLTVAALPARRYRSAYEPGCSIGMLSELLADRCESLLCGDAIEAAVGQARERLAGRRNARVERHSLPDDWPDGAFDLVVLSEILYYFDERQFTAIIDRVRGSIVGGGDLVVVHWRHPVVEHVLTGDEVHQRLSDLDDFQPRCRYRDDDFVLDVLTRTPPAVRSVAEAEGLWP